MSVWRESGIEFDVTAAQQAVRHDEPSEHGNRVWPGVDFCITEPHEQIWLEVKNWHRNVIPAQRRGGQQRSFVSKMRSGPFSQEIRTKFLGTTAFLAWTGQFFAVPARFILLFEPPRPLDAALLVTFGQRLGNQIEHPRWPQVTAAVVTLNEWNMRFPEYPARHF